MRTHLIQSTIRRQQAFTMIEIAISLAVIGFALIAVIGVLPTGMTAQKENREETIINQDGPYFLEAIRNGPHGLDHLTKNIDMVGVVLLDDTNPVPTYITNLSYYSGLQPRGSNIVGLLSLPFGKDFLGRPVERVVARVRAMSGAAVETGGAAKDFAFAYQLTTEVIPFRVDETVMTNTVKTEFLRPEYFDALRNNLYEIKVTCSWPLLPNGKVGPNRKTFRALASGKIDDTHNPLFFFQPHNFKNPKP